MKITNDHYKHKTSGAWLYHDSEVYITDDRGAVWCIRSDPQDGIIVTAHGTGAGDDQIAAFARVGNQFTLRAVTP